MRLRTCPPTVLPQSFAFKKHPSSIAAPLRKLGKRDQILVCQLSFSNAYKLTKLLGSQSLTKHVSRGHNIKRSCTEHIDGLAQRLDLSDYEENEHRKNSTTYTISETSFSINKNSFLQSKLEFLEPIMLGIRPVPPEWPEREAIIRSSIERKANSVDLPLSLRIIKKKQQWQEGLRGLGVPPCCSVKKAFSSMVFIILELQRSALEMREVLWYEDLEGIITKVQREMHASFVWLFQHVFSRTPALMINVMILLANFSLYSTAQNIGIVDHSLLGYETEKQNQQYSKIGSLEINLCKSSLSIQHPNVVPDEISSGGYQEFSSAVEVSLWNSMVNEATKMQVGLRDVVLDHAVMQLFVSPVSVELEQDDYTEYFRTDLLYQMGLSQDPNNSLLLCNYAQFLHLVAHDYERAEECFRQAIEVEPPDAESLSQYANFLWTVRKDLWGAEERYVQAIAAEPGNTYHASRYANFLWSTGGEETYFPLNTTTASNL